jgi:hypothetical protein
MNKEVCRVCIFKFIKEKLSNNRLGDAFNEATQKQHEVEFNGWFDNLSNQTGSAAPCPYMIKSERGDRMYYRALGDFFWFAHTVKIPESCQYRFEQVVSIGVH